MNKKTEFYIFRHGQTDWNIEQRFQGYIDIPLNHVGENQARELSTTLNSLGLEVILSSDLSRAYRTAKLASNDLNIEITKHKELREAHLGDPEGKLKAEVIEKYGQESWDRWCSIDKGDLDFRYPNGESKREHLARAKTFLEKFATENNFTKVGISTHSGVVRRLIHSIDNAPKSKVPIHNCVIYKISLIDDKWSFDGDVKDE